MDELDPAQWRLSLQNDRDDARRRIAIGLGILATMIAIAVVAVLTNPTIEIFAIVYTPFALVIGIKRVSMGMAAHAVASYKLLKLERKSNLPEARLVD